MFKIVTLRALVAYVVLTNAYISHASHSQKLDFFESKIRPALIEHCYECHSLESSKSKGGLLLDSKIGWLTGGDSGPAIIPGKPEASLLIQAIRRTGKIPEMPPKSNLDQMVISHFEEWISQGAIDPRQGEVPSNNQEEIDYEEGRNFWSLRPILKFESNTTIDALVKPRAPVAQPEKLVRRIYLDLIGLPPTPDEFYEFVRVYKNHSPQEAVKQTIKILMKRKEFGEKWARHWLDIARYADSNGGDFNLTFPEAWRYRNYVIDAFNSDMPYDQFIREQIAGDLLPYDSSIDRNRQLIATGFLMISPKMLTERNKAKMHLDIADEQIDTIGRSILGLTLGCARCHDHKFDPVSKEDYYAMTGILHSTRTAEGILMNNVNVSGWKETELIVDKKVKDLISEYEQKISAIQDKIVLAKKNTNKNLGVIVDDDMAEKSGVWRKSTYRPNYVGKNYLVADQGNGPHSIIWKAELKKPGIHQIWVSFGGGGSLAKAAKYSVINGNKTQQIVVDQRKTPNIEGLWFSIGKFDFERQVKTKEKPISAEVILTNEGVKGHLIADAVQFVHVDDLENPAKVKIQNIDGKSLRVLEKELEELKKNKPKTPMAMAARDLNNERLGDLAIRVRGEVSNLGPKVPRGFLQAVYFENDSNFTIPTEKSGRLQLADWLTHSSHPLTARVMSNRVWQHLFGKGIVSTSDNFGFLGSKPSVPNLLDYLANNLIEGGWSIKSLITEIMLSKTYLQEAQSPSAGDPENSLFLHQNIRPASAETIRDSILFISGKLDNRTHGSAVEKLGMYAIETSGKRHASLEETDTLRQRSIYMPMVRGAIPPSLKVFDMPNPDLVTGKRASTSIPSQALFMLNSPFVQQMAQSLSERCCKNQISVKSVVSELFQLILVHQPKVDELESSIDFINSIIDENELREDEAVAVFAQILFSSTEFRFIE